jgi:toxin YoeB
MEIEFARSALEDLKYWRNSENIPIQKRIKTLLQNIELTPFSGIGKPE